LTLSRGYGVYGGFTNFCEFPVRRHFHGEHAVVDGQPEVLFHERFDRVGRRDAHTSGVGHNDAVHALVLGLQHVGQVADCVGHRPQSELTQLAPGRQRYRNRGQSSSEFYVNFCGQTNNRIKRVNAIIQRERNQSIFVHVAPFRHVVRRVL